MAVVVEGVREWRMSREPVFVISHHGQTVCMTCVVEKFQCCYRGLVKRAPLKKKRWTVIAVLCVEIFSSLACDHSVFCQSDYCSIPPAAR